ncbi:MAG: LamG domain-containing protein [Chloroflexi bacterium]|nr:LamG domain-containing protein [Chloroflexota bacterium]
MASIHGYSDRLSVAPGDTIRFMVSCEEATSFTADIVRLINGDTNPAGPGFKEELVASTGREAYPARQQPIHAGSHVVVADDRNRLALTDGFSLHAFIWPTTPETHTQGILARWSADRQAGYALAIEDGRLTLWLGDGAGRVSRVSAERPLLGSVWYGVGATYDARRGTASVYQAPLVNFENGLLGPTLAAQQTTFVEAPVAAGAVASADGPFLIATLSTAGGPGGGHYNGKIDSPRLYQRALTRPELQAVESITDGLVAHWDFAVGIGEHGIPSDLASDVSGNELHGQCAQMPARAMTGASWTGREENFVHAAREYGAIHFHDDDLADAGWSTDTTWTIPDGLPSGVYGARLRAGDAEEHLPFFVRPGRDADRAKILFLVPTASYLAYANARGPLDAWAQQPIVGRTPVAGADYLYLAAHPELGNSCYDVHSDGSGVCYSSARRPIVDMRPRHRNASVGMWQFPADLHLVDWLQARGFRYDVVTDEDLDREGAELVRPYQVVVTGSHPEYYSTRMLDALEGYVQGGGRLMYMGGNGFYWIISYHPEKPYLIEVRRGEGGSRAWQARPGEYFHSTSGERGGLWRNRGRPPQRLVGVGFTAEGFDNSSYYRRLPDGFDPRARFIFEGIGDEELIGDFGLVGGGAAGYELDRYSLQLGTPRDALLLATSEGHSDNYPHVVEEILFMFPGQGGTQDPAVRADLVYFSLPNGGAVFSTGSISWCGSLSHNGYDNNVSRITDNVLRRFASDELPP